MSVYMLNGIGIYLQPLIVRVMYLRRTEFVYVLSWAQAMAVQCCQLHFAKVGNLNSLQERYI